MIDTIIKIRHYVDTNTLNDHISDTDVRELCEKRPRLYSMITKKDCDLNMLYHLITLQEQMKNGKLENEDADKQFGEIAAQQYVYPLVDKGDTIKK